MSPALLHALARSLSLRAKGLGRAAQATLTLAVASGSRCGVAAAARRGVAWEVLPVRCCSGHTTFRPNTSFTGTQEEEEEDDSSRKALTPRSPRPPHLTDLQSSASPDSFMLPSQHQRHQSDLLEAKIYECESADEIFEVYQRHREVMDTRHCLALIRKLSDLVSLGDDNTELLQNEDFEILSSQLFVKCRRMEEDELVTLLKYLCHLRVPSNSKLTQAVLQMLKNQINDLSLKQMIFLDFLLRKMPLTPLSDALLTAIPILLSNALTSAALSDLSLNDLSQAFTICCQGKVEGTGTLLQEMYSRGSVRSVSMAMSLVWTLTQMSSSRMLSRLLTTEQQLTRDVIMKECLEILAKETDALSRTQIDSTLTKISDGYTKRDQSCYNERFLQAVALHSCRTSIPFEPAGHILRKMMKMYYLSDELVHYIVRVIISRPEEVPEARLGVLPILSALAITTSLPKHDLKEALDIIMTHKSLRLDAEEYYKKPLLVVAIDLLSAGYFHPPLMNILTSPDTLSMFMSKYPKDDPNQKRLLVVDQALGQVFQSPCRVPESFLEPGRKLLANQPPTRSSLKAMLLQILHDPSCLVSGVLVDGTYIDHMLALDPEGVPIKLKSDDNPLMRNPSVDTLDVPPEATKLAILDVGSSMVFRPTNILQGQQRLRQTILESAGFKVLPILQSVIFQHRDEEKLLYVKRELASGGGVALSS